MHGVRNNNKLLFRLLTLLVACSTIFSSFPANLNASESNVVKDPATKGPPDVNRELIKSTVKGEEIKPTVAGTVYYNYNDSRFLLLPMKVKDEIEVDDTSNDLIFESENMEPVNEVMKSYPPDRNIKDYPIRNKSGLYIAGFSSQSGQNLLRFSHGGASLLFSPLDSVSVAGKVYQNTISYKNIYPYIDLRYTVEKNHLKEDIIVQKYTGKSDFHFNLNVSNAVFEKNSNGEIYFFDPSSDKQLFYMSKPYALDKNGNRCDLVYMDLSKEGLLIVTIDPEWLNKASYPVIIDPTIILHETTFARSSVAYKQDGTQVSANLPRFEASKFGQAIMVEEGTTNLLNKGSFETFAGIIDDTTEDSFTSWWKGTWDNNAKLLAVSSMRYGTVNAKIDSSLATGISDFAQTVAGCVIGKSYTFTVEAQGSGSIQLWFSGNNYQGWKSFDLTSAPQKFSITVPASGITLTPVIRASARCVVTVNIAMLEQKSYSTSLTDSTRSAETLTIPSTVFTKGNWSVEYTYIPQTADNKSVVATWGLSCVNGDWYRIIQYNNGWFQASVCVGGVEKGISGNPGIALSAKNPYTVCFTGDGSYLRLYVNGAQIGTAVAYTEPTSALSTNMFIGTDCSGNYTSNGIIDDLRISNCARTATEIQVAYNSGQPLPVDADTTLKVSFDNSSIASIPVIDYVYDSLNRLNTIVTPKKTINYHYDDNGNLIRRTIN